MNYDEVLSIVGSEYELAMQLVDYIRIRLPGAEYENISKRKPGTVPSVYLNYQGQRPLSFDLRKRGGVKVYFWRPKRLKREIEEKFDIVPERRTGWKGFPITGEDDPTLEEALQSISSYWRDCVAAIAEGEDTAQWKREDLVKSMVKEAFPEESIVFNKQSIPASTSKPDIFLSSRKAIIQVDGAQHFRFVPIFHPTQSVFEDQLARDESSNELALRAGFTVLRIVTDAVDMLSPGQLREYVEEAATKSEVMYLVRDGAKLVLTGDKPEFP